MKVGIHPKLTKTKIESILSKHFCVKNKEERKTKANLLYTYLQNKDNFDKVKVLADNYKNNKCRKTRRRKGKRRDKKKKTRTVRGGVPIDQIVMIVIIGFAFYWIDLIPGSWTEPYSPSPPSTPSTPSPPSTPSTPSTPSDEEEKVPEDSSPPSPHSPPSPGGEEKRGVDTP